MSEQIALQGIDVTSLEWAFPFSVSINQQLFVIWASKAIVDRIPNIKGKKIFEVFSPVNIDNNELVKVRLLCDEDELPIEGSWVHNGKTGKSFLGMPDLHAGKKFSIFSASDFPRNSVAIDLLIAKDEHNTTIKEINRAIQELSNNERRLKKIIDTMSEGVLLFNSDGQLHDANQSASEILGVSKLELLNNGKNANWNLFCQDTTTNSGCEIAGFCTVYKAKSHRNNERVVVRKDNTKRYVLCNCQSSTKANGDTDFTIITMVDVTQSRKIEKVLARSEATMRVILNNAPFGIILIDTQSGFVTMSNRYASKVLGVAQDEIDGHVCSQFSVTDLQSSKKNDERKLNASDGRIIPVLQTVVPVDINSQSYILNCFVDISDRKNLEAQLNHAQKMESVGRLAAGIAHEINTPSQYVGDNTNFLKDAFTQLSEVITIYEELAKNVIKGNDTGALLNDLTQKKIEIDLEYLLEDIPKAISQSLEGIKRVSSIVRAMKEFAHPGSEKKTLADINSLIQTTVTVSRNEWKYAAEIEFDLTSELPPVPCYPGEINQVFLNLIVNSAHAVADAQKARGGGLGKIILHTHVKDRKVIIKVEDNGTGIPKSIRDRIMDPFFTTKEVGKGTGQGLAIARSCVVDKHQGEFSFESEEGVGTTFIISLPY